MSQQRVFTEVFGDYPQVRILEQLIISRAFDCSLTDIKEGAEVGWTTVLDIMKVLEKKSIVKHTRNIGNAKLFKLNLENPLVTQLVDMSNKLVRAVTLSDLKSDEITLPA